MKNYYENFDDFMCKNSGEYYFFTRYGHKPHSSFDYSNEKNEELYFIFGKESRAEVPIAGEIDGRLVSAQIDRLVISDNKVNGSRVISTILVNSALVTFAQKFS